ncbi:hypothetical protein BDAG_03966 [Burkholderia dolosa AU0158]|nr:hypothetical protein BDAG_03966 [Burkholderia dolosa AU0158]
MPARYDVRGRADGEGDHDTAILLDCHDRGGWLPGMLDDARLVAAVARNGTRQAAAEVSARESRLARSRASERLCRAAGPHARSGGAEHLYVRDTVATHDRFPSAAGFYGRRIPRSDPAPDALEPNDIHPDELTH